MKEILRIYNSKKQLIKSRLNDFKNLSAEEKFNEFLFCLLTPQSNAQKCWRAVEEISKIKNINELEIKEILKTRTRFHNNKTEYISEGYKNWNNVKSKLSEKNIPELRNWLAKNVKGYGLKEAGHFLRNIGISDNKITILDRHILRNLKKLNIIAEEKIKSPKHYLEIEQSFLKFSEQIKIPVDELDLLWWSQENGEIFK